MSLSNDHAFQPGTKDGAVGRYCIQSEVSLLHFMLNNMMQQNKDPDSSDVLFSLSQQLSWLTQCASDGDDGERGFGIGLCALSPLGDLMNLNSGCAWRRYTPTRSTSYGCGCIHGIRGITNRVALVRGIFHCWMLECR